MERRAPGPRPRPRPPPTPPPATRRSRRPTLPDGFGDLDRRAIDTARVLAMDAVQKVGNGHPGTAMSMAPTAYLLFQKWLRHDPSDPHWAGRDRFVLSMGHSSLTLYVQLYLSGYGLELDDLKALRTWGSQTPGHPEVGHTPGVETTTGPLGQGVGNAVGMAMAARRERGLFDPDAPEGESLFDHTIWCFASDGDLEEGVSGEASSLAGTQQLGNLVAGLRRQPDLHRGRHEHRLHRGRRQALRGLRLARAARRRRRGPRRASTPPSPPPRPRPGGRRSSCCATIIGWPAPEQAEHRRGARLGARRRRGRGHQGGPGLRPGADLRGRRPRSSSTPARSSTAAGRRTPPGRSPSTPGSRATRRARRCSSGMTHRAPCPTAGPRSCPSCDADPKGVATRKASGKVLAALVPGAARAVGRLGRPGGEQQHRRQGRAVVPARPNRQTKMWSGGPYGRTLHFGIREHAMGSIMNGIALHGGTRVYGGTFLMFSDYMRGAVRLAALMQLPVTYVWTHDSIGLGEDGPTHQPIEHLAALRAIPGLDVVRPADANETAVAWRTILEHTDRPGRDRPVPAEPARSSTATDVRLGRGRRPGRLRPRRGVDRHPAGDPHRHRLRGADRRRRARGRSRPTGIPTRVVSMPCVEWFAAQDQAYRERGAAAVGPRPGQRRGRRRPGLARVRRRRRADRRPRSTSAPAPPTPCSTSSSASPPTPWSPPRTTASRPPPPTPSHRPARPAGVLHRPTGDR